ncbi:TetR/AcrR family transcriptional regulator [Mycolicibacterium holsaticum]|jgi:AcrR family transcriptional regulator|uniref:TetR family transcriptional regulator n=1 Tax=Mycolicibacterium holsaticum TaxID=152142 RepID=A0A1E3RU50_9MYCO|nr:TetR/AcrR family transcriptional regulator [Mycolicibacterium holsaticum]MDA4110786.1 TetR family transcriptional regulator [Mycolicibacterium holsaticum DSM 44478 = JCM 12374]ODQ92942.1 TetR family transcriptional regulator [Mycolicibacterium holsaticum]QZA12258.1 TetR/AcrR family transcriptional regulator [Mycolicibacterium holsaticum DSM 44478 = JCM 12374]UNC10256.1 TetR/AcrR family transcriptional regulator [Mycolicibacterium holsaticum DSM 44478 = JCM 12374]
MAQVRPYRGVDAAERLAQRRRRLLDAGLDLLGAGAQDPAELTVRAVCAQAGLGVRYFYESFTDKDDFVGAVFDSVVADIASTTQAAVASAPPEEQARAGMANVVHSIAADARVGRLLFSVELSNTVIVRKRAESTALFAALLFQHAGAMGAGGDERIKASAHFAVGGVGQTISAWLSGDVDLEPDQLVEQLATALEVLAQM